MYLHIYMFSIYTYPFLDLTQQFSLPAAPSRLIKGDLFLQSVGLMPSLNLAFPSSFTLLGVHKIYFEMPPLPTFLQWATMLEIAQHDKESDCNV